MSKPKIVTLDIDGCLADFTSAYAAALIAEDGDRLPEGWQDSPDWPGVWYWEREAGYGKDVEKRVWDEYILKEDSAFWENLEPMHGAREVLMELNGLVKAGKAETYFVTHRMGDRAKLQTEKWLYNHGCDYPTVFMAGDKIPVLRFLKPDFFIDDKPETVSAVADSDSVMRDGLFLKMAPYNKDLWSDPRFQKAASVKDALITAGVIG